MEKDRTLSLKSKKDTIDNFRRERAKKRDIISINKSINPTTTLFTILVVSIFL